MSFKYFGQFLIERGYLTKEQLLDILSVNDNEKLANLAVHKNLMSFDKAQEILKKSYAQKTKDFAHVALEDGLISKEQHDYLLFLHKGDVRSFCETLLDKEILDNETYLYLIDEYSKEQANFSLGSEQLPEKLIDRPHLIALMKAIREQLQKSNILPYELQIPSEYTGNIADRDVTMQVTFSGELPGQILFTLDHNLAVIIAGQLFGNEMLDSWQILCDAIGEFLNIVVGSAASSLSDYGYAFTFDAPVNAQTLVNPVEIGLGSRWELVTPWGQGEIFIE